MADRPLTGKQLAFVEHYLQTLNATEAARRAKYNGSNGSLRVTGHRLLTHPNVRARIKARLAEVRIETDEILGRLASIARFSIADLADALEFADPVDIIRKAEELGQAHLIKKIRVKPATEHSREIIEVEFHDPLRALEILARHLLPTAQKLEVESTREIIIDLVPLRKDVRTGQLVLDGG